MGNHLILEIMLHVTGRCLRRTSINLDCTHSNFELPQRTVTACVFWSQIRD